MCKHPNNTIFCAKSDEERIKKNKIQDTYDRSYKIIFLDIY